MGRDKRFATDHQRRAAAIRDGGCAFHGCDTPVSWCDLHHIDHWEHGGPTDLDNLICLCRHHHGVTHR
ncbi:HNH endonuclease signature motif containing protein, partial [Pseudomonas sp. CCI2.4]|uniref:HNH endonuclease signature motif containing protein n=1 Tax=Pseudomonas sp. CCI2.4 TaxID=3048617 RepID=UPI0034DD18C9